MKAIWERFLDYELGHLHHVRELFERAREARPRRGRCRATLPEPLQFESQREFVREMLAREVDLRANGKRIRLARRGVAERRSSTASSSTPSGSPSRDVAGGYRWRPGTELAGADAGVAALTEDAMAKTHDTKPTDIGTNRTGIADLAAARAKEMIEASEQSGRRRRRAGARSSSSAPSCRSTRRPMGRCRRPASMKGAAKTVAKALQGEKANVLLDKLGERLAFERTGVRLYDAVLAKIPASRDDEGRRSTRRASGASATTSTATSTICRRGNRAARRRSHRDDAVRELRRRAGPWGSCRSVTDPRATLTQCLDDAARRGARRQRRLEDAHRARRGDRAARHGGAVRRVPRRGGRAPRPRAALDRRAARDPGRREAAVARLRRAGGAPA